MPRGDARQIPRKSQRKAARCATTTAPKSHRMPPGTKMQGAHSSARSRPCSWHGGCLCRRVATETQEVPPHKTVPSTTHAAAPRHARPRRAASQITQFEILPVFKKLLLLPDPRGAAQGVPKPPHIPAQGHHATPWINGAPAEVDHSAATTGRLPRLRRPVG